MELVLAVEDVVALLAVPLDAAHAPRGEVEEGQQPDDEQDQEDQAHARHLDFRSRNGCNEVKERGLL